MRLPTFFLIGLVAACGRPAVAMAQADTQVWTSLSASGAIAEPVQGSADTVARFSDPADGLYQIVSSVALGYRLRKRLVLWGGYVYAPNYRRGGSAPLEQRAREEVDATLGTFGGGTFAARVRGEERWRADGRDTGWRGRVRLQWTRPFHVGGTTAIVLTHESFVNFDTTDWGQKAGYERMRNAAAIATPIVPRVTASIGYLNQHGFVHGGRDTSDNVATFGLSLAF